MLLLVPCGSRLKIGKLVGAANQACEPEIRMIPRPENWLKEVQPVSLYIAENRGRPMFHHASHLKSLSIASKGLEIVFFHMFWVAGATAFWCLQH